MELQSWIPTRRWRVRLRGTLPTAGHVAIIEVSILYLTSDFRISNRRGLRRGRKQSGRLPYSLLTEQLETGLRGIRKFPERHCGWGYTDFGYLTDNRSGPHGLGHKQRKQAHRKSSKSYGHEALYKRRPIKTHKDAASTRSFGPAQFSYPKPISGRRDDPGSSRVQQITHGPTCLNHLHSSTHTLEATNGLTGQGLPVANEPSSEGKGTQPSPSGDLGQRATVCTLTLQRDRRYL
ncbi:hypothetical protein F0562_013536 [Nyssa sinensis]|uniref:Uncharacterized protein n=1 Tax=Nyssa sinensis TaxID=561372 RepID=A0A5J4ZKZ3_9ASTE|nr:hypothetical protein F0562_013536 [Nyssa sinensis]